jgi:hypothetical protein
MTKSVKSTDLDGLAEAKIKKEMDNGQNCG